MQSIIYNQNGKETGTIELPESIFGLSWNADLVHQVVVSMESNDRDPIAHTKNRGDVRGGGKKPWKQKGTGRARHGSTRSPIWVGGGVAHGPRNEKNYSRKVNRKMKAKALFTILSKKFKEGELIFMDTLSFKAPKTKEAKSVLESLSTIKAYKGLLSKRKNSAIIAIDSNNEAVKKSFSNFSNIEVEEMRNLNPVSVLNYKYLVITNPKDSVAFMQTKMNPASMKETK